MEQIKFYSIEFGMRFDMFPSLEYVLQYPFERSKPSFYFLKAVVAWQLKQPYYKDHKGVFHLICNSESYRYQRQSIKVATLKINRLGNPQYIEKFHDGLKFAQISWEKTRDFIKSREEELRLMNKVGLELKLIHANFENI